MNVLSSSISVWLATEFLDRPALQPGIALAFLPLPLGLRRGLTLEAKAHAVLRFAPDIDGLVGHRFARLAIGGFRDRAGLLDPLLLRAAVAVPPPRFAQGGHDLVDALQPCLHGLRFRASVDRAMSLLWLT